ncbi:MAG: TIR domain-containing protein [Steroidobacteraceae bacterium]
MFDAIKKKLDRSRPAVYRLISDQARRLSVRPEIAALEVASMAGLNFQRFASEEQLEALRRARTSAPSSVGLPTTAAPTPAARKQTNGGRRKSKSPGKVVWIVHGRDDKLRRAMFDFVRSLGLEPLEWSSAVKATRKGSPYPGEVLDKAFLRASAVIVLLTPDDEAQLRRVHWRAGEEAYEKRLMGQARPNVLFEAGMAFGTHPAQTVIVEIGKCRPFTDTHGRLVVRMNDTAPKRKELADRLAAAGCTVDITSSNAWMEAGDFSSAG